MQPSAYRPGHGYASTPTQNRRNDPSMLDEEALINGCIRGERAMQRALYERFSRKMLVVCMRYSKGRQEAEDILQDSFIKVFDHIRNFRRECPLEGWVRRIVVNTALNHNRSKLYLYPALDLEDVETTVDENLTLADIHFEELLALVQKLAPRYQIVFNLFAIEGYSHKEIAAMLDISEGTSKSQYARARVILQQMIAEKQKVNYERFK
jgi:RNA polymerase sigma-70 factor (ECF subfamily)